MADKRINIIVDVVDKASQKISGINNKINQMSGKFAGWALSLMFLGWQMQRTFGQIAKVGMDSFMKITEGQTAAGQAAIGLSAAWQFLQFTIGDAIATALMPLMPLIVNIIEIFADWISQNPQLVSSIILIGGAFGSLLAVGGMFAVSIGPMMGVISAIIGALGGPLTLAIVGIVAAIAILGIAWSQNWGDIRGQFAGFWTWIEPIWNGFLGYLKLLGLYWMGMFQIWVKVLETAWAVIKIPLNFIWGIFDGFVKSLFPEVKDTWAWLWDGIVKGLEGAWTVIEPIFNSIKWFLDAIISGANTVGSWAGQAGNMLGGAAGQALGGRQFGGYIPQTGMYKLHAGESVSPAGGGVNVTVNTGPINSNVDIDYLARRVGEAISDKVHNYTNPTTGRWVR